MASSPITRALKILRLVLPWVGSAVLLYWVSHRVPLAEVKKIFAELDPGRFLLIWTPAEIVIYIANVLTFKLFLDWFVKPLSFRELAAPIAATYLLGMVNPFLGLGAVLVYLNRRRGTPAVDLGGNLLFLLAVDFFLYTVLVAVGLAYLDRHPQGQAPGAAIRLLQLGVIGGAIFYAYFYLFWIRKFDFGVLGFQRRVKAFLPFALARPRHYAIYFLVRTAYLGGALIRQYLVMRYCFHVVFPFGRYLALVPLANFLGALPVSVAGYGASQVVWLGFFGEYVTQPTLVAMTLSWNAAYTFFALVIGLSGLGKIYWDLRRAAKRATA